MITVNADFKKIVQQDSDILIDNRAQHNRVKLVLKVDTMHVQHNLANPAHQNDAGKIQDKKRTTICVVLFIEAREVR